jgi:CRP/FNR family nitrogen fixation transcriptional regulator
MLHWQNPARSGKVISLDAIRQDQGSIDDTIDLMGARMRFARNAEVFGEGEPAEYLYKVVSGAVRISKLLSDGRRQIGAFYLTGDVFGLEPEAAHHFSAETIVDSEILIIRRSALMSDATRNSDVIAQLWNQTIAHLQQAQEHMLLLGRKNAQERIVAFLLDMSKRLSTKLAVELPMSRQDIADYLGLTIETVSRTLTQLERDGIISIPVSRRILLRDPAALDEINDDCLAA